MPKIIFVNRFFHPDYSATSQLLSDLAFHLAARTGEHLPRVHVVTGRQRYDDPAAGLAPAEIVQAVNIHRVWTTHFGRGNLPGRAVDYLTFYTSAGWRLWRLARRGDIVVAKTDPPLISVVAGWVAFLRRARLVNWLQDLFPEVARALGVKGLRGPVGGLLRHLRNRSLKRAAANVVLGDLMGERLRAEGIDDTRIRLIPNWADGAAIKPIMRDLNPLRREWGLVGKFVVGYSGNLGRAHDLSGVLDTAAAFQQRAPAHGAGNAPPELAFLFIGGGHQRRDLEAEAAKRGLTNVMFKPYQPREQLRQSLGAADVHLVSLRPELEGLIVPSKACGVFAADRATIYLGDPDGEIGRLLAKARAGVTVAPGDAAGLTAAIDRLVSDPALMHKMGHNARKLFEERFDRTIALAGWTRLLDSIQGVES